MTTRVQKRYRTRPVQAQTTRRKSSRSATIFLVVLPLTLIVLAVGNMFWSQISGLFRAQDDVLGSARTTLTRVEKQSKLITSKAFVQAVVRQRDDQWYGNAEVIRMVPATIHYAIDLAAIDKEKMRYDKDKNELVVPLPDVQITAIDPDLAHMEVIRNLDLLRSQAATGNPLEEATEKMVRPTLEKMSRSPQAVRSARDQAINAVKTLLESAFAATGRAVHVQPYFRNGDLPE
ncbi:MAG: DUF4230 domain-containing protein [Blastocatellia bacterium]